MLKNLIEKRNSLLKQYDEVKNKLEAEKRTAYSNEEREAINKLKIDIEEVDKSIEIEKEFDAKRSVKLDATATSVAAPAFVTTSTDPSVKIVTSFRSFLDEGKSGEKFTIPFETFTHRATVTTSTNTHFSFVDQNNGLQISHSDLVLPKLGVKTYYFDAGAVDFPAISQVIGSFGTEDGSVSDQALSSSKRTLTPTFVSASIEVSKVFLKSSKPQNIQDLMDTLKVAVDKAVERRCIDSMSSLTHITSGATGNTGVSFFAISVEMEKNLLGSPSGYIFSASGIAKAKRSRKDAGSGEFVYKDGFINGFPAVRSTLQSNVNHGYLVTASALAQAYWGEGIQIEMVTDATLSRKGNVLLIASALADATYLDSSKIAVIKNVDKLTV